MKKIISSLLLLILGSQVKRLRNKNSFKTVAIAGSIGKTSTKFAIASVLQSTLKVQWQKGNYNHVLIVPLVFFGHNIPSLFNPFSWLKIILSNELQLRKKYPYDVVIIELGTDGPGQIKQFEKYLHNNIAVITSIAPEHMEFFNDVDDVAKEELSVVDYSEILIMNTDLVDKKYYKRLKQIISFGTQTADFVVSQKNNHITIQKNNREWLSMTLDLSGRNKLYSLTAATVVANKLGLADDEIKNGAQKIITPPGRMQLLRGINNSTIVDETYNASPEAVIAALDYLYEQKTPQRIALLGNMNELGDYSQSEHERIGKYCDPKKLDYVITLGPEANKYLAPIAKQKGCTVRSFMTPYEVGDYVKEVIKPGAVIMAKGSQNNVFMEEALKSFLESKADERKLVRQSADWLAKKRKNFAK